MLRGRLDGATAKSREWQREQQKRTGFVTPQAEIGHQVIAKLIAQGYHPTLAIVAGHLAAVGTSFNWMGNARIAELVARSERTVQRARAKLEADGLISSHILLTGDMIDGQRSPVRHPQVVRDVSRLQRLATVREQQRQTAPPRKGKRPSAADMPAPAPAPAPDPADADFFRQQAEAHPEYAAFFNEMAAAAKKKTIKPPPNAATHITPELIDEWDRRTKEIEHELDLDRAIRGPPGRGPPN